VQFHSERQGKTPRAKKLGLASHSPNQDVARSLHFSKADQKESVAGSPNDSSQRNEMAQRIVTTRRPAYQAYQILYIGFIVAPFLAGLDKFTNFLVNWEQYLAPAVEQLLPITGHTFMLVVGIVEMAAAGLVAVRPRIGAYVVAAWLLGIIVNLLLIPGYFDVALRDFGLALAALALARLSEEFVEAPVRARHPVGN
jgi:hypothetical protein